MKLNQLIESLLSKESGIEIEVSNTIQILKEDMLVKAKFYEGDLLMTVLAIDKSFWKSNPIYWKQLIEILNHQEHKIKDQQVSFEMKGDWYEKIERFKSY